jgi:hypothetical protein
MAPDTTSSVVTVTARTVTGVQQHRLELTGERDNNNSDAAVRVRLAALYAAVATATSASAAPPYPFSLVHSGATLPPPVSTAGAAALARLAPTAAAPAAAAAAAGAGPGPDPHALLRDGDVLVIVPRRAAPSDHARRAAAAASSFGGDAAALARRRGGGFGNANNHNNNTGGDESDDEDEELRQYRPPADAYAWERRLGGWLHAQGAPPLALAWLFLARPSRLALVLLIAAGARVAHNYGWGPPYVLLWLIAAMLLNLGRRREGEASAYSLFNAGLRRLPGQLDAAHMDAQIRAGGGI